MDEDSVSVRPEAGAFVVTVTRDGEEHAIVLTPALAIAARNLLDVFVGLPRPAVPGPYSDHGGARP